MSVLTSKLFTEADQVTVGKLENCATGVPSEVASHFAQSQRGEHIRRVQEALQAVKQGEPGLGIPLFVVNGIYDEQFAKAVRVYKTKRNIKNFAGKFDDIVGFNTIRSLDRDNKSGSPKVNPTPLPRRTNPKDIKRLTNCVEDAECPESNQFDITLVAGGNGGEGAEIGKFIFAIRDTSNGLSAGYVLRTVGGGLGLPLGIVGGGKPKHITTSSPVRVTRFGPGGSIGSLSQKAGVGPFTVPVTPLGAILPDLTVIVFSFRPENLLVRSIPPTVIDSGPLVIPGFFLHAGVLSILTDCNGQPGATRRILSLIDFPR